MASDAEIMDAFDSVADDEVFPREAPFDFFYKGLPDTGYSVFLKDGERYGIYLLETDDMNEALLQGRCGVFIISLNEESKTVISLVYEIAGWSFTIRLPFEHYEPRHVEFLKGLKIKKSFQVRFLNYLYGGLVKAGARDYHLPDEETSRITEFT